MKVSFGVSGEDQGLGVPYPKDDSPDSANVGYFDIKRNPENTLNFPELHGWAELKEFIEVINRTDSLFRTLRCDVASSDFNRSPYTKKITSYVTTAFEILDWNRVTGTYEDLYKRFCEFATGSISDSTVIDFELVPTSYLDHGINRGWSVDVWNTGLGGDDKEARVAWIAGIEEVKGFLVRESTIYSDQLRLGRQTIS